MNKNKMTLAMVSISAGMSTMVLANVENELSNKESRKTIEVITVKGQALNRLNFSNSATQISTEDIRSKQVKDINELLEDVPGVSIRDYGLGGVASSTIIRGFGDGAHGGDLGVVIDGLPLNEANSHADGYADLNVVVPLEIEQVTVYKGPISALYGNFNRGGLLALETRSSGNYTDIDISGGAFDTFDAQVAVGNELNEKHNVNFAAQHFTTDGFRPQSDARRSTVSGQTRYRITEQLEFGLSGRYHDAKASSAGYTTLAQFDVDPYGIDPRVKNDGTEKEFGTARADVGYVINQDTKLLTYAYTTQQTFTRWFSRGGAQAENWRQREETYDRDVYGVGTSLNGVVRLGTFEFSYVAGLEHFNEETDFQFYEDLDNRKRVSLADFNRRSTLTSNAVFAEADLNVTESINVSLGLRADQFDGDCQRLGAETAVAPCEELESVSNVSPKASIHYNIIDSLQLRASYSEGFALASGFAKFASGAQDLEVNEIKQYEAGLFFLPSANLEFDVSLYDIQSSNEINEVAQGEFINFGQTTRKGLEASVRWKISEQFEVKGVFGQSDSEVDSNLNRGLLGKAVNGVPEQTATLMLDWFPSDRLRFNTTLRYMGEYFINTENSSSADDYTVLDLLLTYNLNVGESSKVFVRVDNVTDEVYASTVNGLGASPGAPRALYAGVQLSF
ncbi:TonB-dependent receptor [Thalassotalea hakodatensis]|uniref:TonB-dependent receptor n=1 Tax=Thalassotalea hakodatensis TaxID=3030492 RepID=UPI002573EB15|nr:TonB-dependent receptor [Thalassotalea hakodatensis]